MIDLKPVEFRGSALDDLRAFPQAARREAGINSTKSSMGASPTTGSP
jgi:phage-related protein